MKIVVLKIGGKELNKKKERHDFIGCVKKLRAKNFQCVVAHGGGNEVDAWLKKMKIKPKFINGLRATDSGTLEVVESVLSGKVNKTLVSALVKEKVMAVGLSGKDGGMVFAKRARNKSLGRVGDVHRVNSRVLLQLLKADFLPVIASVAADAGGNSLNVNADMFSAGIAAALRAQMLILVSDVPGVFGEDGNIISSLTVREAKKLMRSPVIKSGMLPKLSSCADAVARGVKRAYILDSKTLSAKLNDVLAGKHGGTMIHAGE